MAAALLPFIAIAPLRAASADHRLRSVALLFGDQPAGVAISRSGRIFITFPRHTGSVAFTEGELRGGQPVAFPNAAINRPTADAAGRTLFSVQTNVVDDQNQLWLLDTGVLQVGTPPLPGAPKLVVISLESNKVVRSIPISTDALLENSALKDVRLAPKLGRAGTAFITDSAPRAEALIVVDLASGIAVRRLQGSPLFDGRGAPVAVVEGAPLLVREKGKAPVPFEVGLNAIEISPDQQTLYLGPFTGGRLLTLPAALAADPRSTDAELAASLRVIGTKPVAGHFTIDSQGRLYAMDMQTNAVQRRATDGTFHTVVRDGRLLWPDTIAIGPAGCLYVTASQYDRGPRFHDGHDLRRRPFGLYRLPIEGGSCPATTEASRR